MSDKQTPFLSEGILHQNGDRAIFVAGAQQVAGFFTARILSTHQAHRDAWIATQGEWIL